MKYFCSIFTLITFAAFASSQSCSEITQSCAKECSNFNTVAANNICGAGVFRCQCAYKSNVTNGDSFCTSQKAMCGSKHCVGKQILSNDCDPVGLFSRCQCEGTNYQDMEKFLNATDTCYAKKCAGKNDTRAFCDDPNKPICDCEGNREDNATSGSNNGGKSSEGVRSQWDIVGAMILILFTTGPFLIRL